MDNGRKLLYKYVLLIKNDQGLEGEDERRGFVA